MLQVIVPDSLESIVADVVCQVGGADPSERHRGQLGLYGIINISIINA